MTVRAALAPLVILGALAGCSEGPYQTAYDAVGVTLPLTAGAMHVFNGSYQGTIRQIKSGPGCPLEHGEKVIMVGDGVLWYAYSPTTYFTSPVEWDGTIDATSGDTRMEGRIKGDELRATVKSPLCETAIRMHYVLNHGS